MAKPATPYDQDVSVLKLIRKSFPGRTDGPAVLCRNRGNGLFIYFRETPTLLRILDRKEEVFVRARFVGCVLVFGERVKSWEPESDPYCESHPN